MAISDGDIIVPEEINVRFSDAPTGITEGIDAMKGMTNAYTVLRFRTFVTADPEDNRQFFTCPDDLDIYAVGISARWGTPGGNAATITVRVQGAITDLQSDLPLPKHLFLTEPITNVEGELQLELSANSATRIDSVRYVTYDVDSNRPANTLLKGSKYEVITSATCSDVNYMVETYIVCQNSLRRN